MDWRDKANTLIASMCRESYLKANTKPGGGMYKKHRPYVVPEAADRLVACLGRDDEAEAKALFLYNYDCEQAMK